MWLVDLNYNSQCDCLIELSDNNFAKYDFFKPIRVEEIEIFMIRHDIVVIWPNLGTVNI